MKIWYLLIALLFSCSCEEKEGKRFTDDSAAQIVLNESKILTPFFKSITNTKKPIYLTTDQFLILRQIAHSTIDRGCFNQNDSLHVINLLLFLNTITFDPINDTSALSWNSKIKGDSTLKMLVNLTSKKYFNRDEFYNYLENDLVHSPSTGMGMYFSGYNIQHLGSSKFKNDMYRIKKH